jgi:hypothetical protein
MSQPSDSPEPTQTDAAKPRQPSASEEAQKDTPPKPEVTIFGSIGHFIDTQISAALQSVIGLPSAMVNPNSKEQGGNGGVGGGRWMVYDEQARRRQEEEMRKWGGKGGEGEGEGESGKEHGTRTTTKRMEKDESEGGEKGWGWWTRHQEDGNGNRRLQHAACRRHRNRKASNADPEEDDATTKAGYQVHEFGPILIGRLQDHDWPPMLTEGPSEAPFPFPLQHQHPLFHHFFNSPFPDVMSSGPAWPLTYIIFSPYSPLHLEQRFPNPSSSNIPRPASNHWRDAFEDLMRTQAGKEMLPRTARAEAPAGGSSMHDTHNSGGEWIRALIQRGSLGDLKLPDSVDSPQDSTAQIATRIEELDQGEEKHHQLQHEKTVPPSRFTTESSDPTETDMYEALWGLSEHRHEQDKHIPKPQFAAPETPTAPAPPPPSASPAPATTSPLQTPGKESIISTLTTTTRTTLPDGSVETKVILKKRFGDGREEVKETEYLDYANGKSSPKPQGVVERAYEGKQKDQGMTKGEGKKKGGWFWN